MNIEGRRKKERFFYEKCRTITDILFHNCKCIISLSIIHETASVINSLFLFQTSSNNVQDIIESRVEKRTKGVYVPVGGKKLLTFMDDFNMPAKDTFGSQASLELIKLWLDYGFWYDRLKQTIKYIKVSSDSHFLQWSHWFFI